MTLLERITNYLTPKRDDPLSLDDWLQYFNMGNFFPSMSWAQDETVERIEGNFTGYATGAYQANGIVFACMSARQMLFSQARFKFRQIRNGRPGDLFGTQALSLLEEPWPGATTADLLQRVILYADLAGTSFVVRRYGQLIVPRPDWIHIIAGSMNRAPPGATLNDLHATIAGYVYHPGGENSGEEPVALLPEDVAYFAPNANPLSKWRGMSWLTPIIREILGDSASATHKVKFLEKAATPNMIITFDPAVAPDKAKAYIDLFRKEHEGAANAYKTLFLGGGANQAQVVGANLRQMDFKSVQAAGEVRIAAASGIHPVLLGISESLAGSSLNSGNFSAARRLTADRTFRPLWENICGSLAHLVDVPSDAELWYDDRDIPFLMNDVQDQVNILQAQMSAIVQGVREGFRSDATIDAVVSGDLGRLRGQHTGLLSVQLQPPLEENPVAEAPPAQLPARSSGEVRCECGNLLAEMATPPYKFTCRKCKAAVAA